MTGALFLEELAEAMRNAAQQLLESDEPWHQRWGAHLLEDRKSVFAMALTWRDPLPAEGGEG